MTFTQLRETGAHALLSDGTTVRIRPARPGDTERVLRLYDEMSAENLRLRFFGASRTAGVQAAQRLFGRSRPGHRALVAVQEERVIGVAEYEHTDDPGAAEVSVAVADDVHHRGVGTLLVEHLADAARQCGVRTFTADTLASNHLMQQLITDLGLPVERRYEDGEVHVTIALTPDEHFLEAVDHRGAAANPVDATAAVGEQELSSCVDKLSAHGAVDAVIVVLVPTALSAATGDNPMRALTHADPARRPRTVAAVLLDQAERVRLLHCGGSHTVPAYADPRSAARALAHGAERSRWLARPAGDVPRPVGVDPAGARAVVEHFLAEHPDGGWLDPRRRTELLAHYRIPQLPTAFAETEDQAVEAARELTDGAGRAALKAYWPGLLHKSEQGAVLLDLEGEDGVRAAYRDLAARFGDAMTGVVVQPMAGRGTELVAGVVQDEVFGPLVLFGLGGTATELLADHAARLAPLTDADVRDLVTAPRCAPLLFGYRGAVPVDLQGLEQLLAHLSAMACDLPQIAEVDLNPVIARHDGVAAVDVRVRIAPRHPLDPYLRRLR